MTTTSKGEKSASSLKTVGDSARGNRASTNTNTKLVLAFVLLSCLGLFLSGGERSLSLVEATFGPLPLTGVDIKADVAKTARVASFAATALLSLYLVSQVMGEDEVDVEDDQSQEENTKASAATTATSTTTTTKLTLKNVIGASRPPMWFATAFPYMLSATDASVLSSPDFYVGLAYVTLPLNLFLCGLNDVMDWDVDHLSKKRASAWRQNLTRVQLEKLRRIIWIMQAPFFLWSVSLPHGDGIASSSLLWWLNASFQIALYNGGSSGHSVAVCLLV